MGKSSLGRQRRGPRRAKHGKPAAFFSLEMSEAELAHRFIATERGSRATACARGRSEKDWPGSYAPATSSRRRRCGSTTPPTSAAGPARQGAPPDRLGGRPGLIIIDYIQLMRPEDPRQNRVEQVGQISRGLKILARELDVPSSRCRSSRAHPSSARTSARSSRTSASPGTSSRTPTSSPSSTATSTTTRRPRTTARRS